MDLVSHAEVWPLHTPFTISRGRKTEARVVVAEIRARGRVGRGECVPYPRYGETVAGVLAQIDGLRAAAAAGQIDRQTLLTHLPAGAARNAVDAALWDLEAQQAGRPVAALLGETPLMRCETAQTIVIDTPTAMARAAAALAGAPLIKVKLGAEAVPERLAAIRAQAPTPRLIVDANEAWSPALLEALGPVLAAQRVDLVEQPLPAGEDAVLERLDCPVALCADESVHVAADIPRLVRCYDYVNIKLDKAGGLTAACALAEAAQAAGLGIMVGCMVGTSLAMAPALVLAARADFVDLDGPLWLARDRDGAFGYDRGRLSLSSTPLWGGNQFT